MSNPQFPAPLPLNGDELGDDLSVEQPDAVKEVDGREVLDPDANDDLIDSADADKIASGADDA